MVKFEVLNHTYELSETELANAPQSQGPLASYKPRGVARARESGLRGKLHNPSDAQTEL